MALEQLSPDDRRVIGECLRAAPVFIDLDLDAVTGVEWADFERVAAAYPDVSDADETVALAIHGALLNLVFYPHGHDADWAEFISVPRDELPAVHHRWMALMGWETPEAASPGELYFRLMR